MQSPVLMINEAGATHRPDKPPPRPRGQHTYENRRERERDDGEKKKKKTVSAIQRVPVEKREYSQRELM